MNKIILICSCIIICITALAQKNDKTILTLVSKNIANNDTSFFCNIVKSAQGYTFVFPEVVSYYLKERDKNSAIFDTVWEKRTPEFGPYLFLRKKDKILFRDFKRSEKFEDLYEIRKDSFYAPNLFASNTESYSILTQLLDSNVRFIDKSNNSRVFCYKFLQIFKDHYNTHEAYRVLYIDKKTLVPYKLEYYAERELKIKNKDIFISNTPKVSQELYDK